MASGDRSNMIAIELHRERCLHVRSVRSQCSLCSDSCPGFAITLDVHGRPELDASHCVQCGQCLTACPLEVFESPTFTERQLVNRIDTSMALAISCYLPYGQLENLGRGVRTYQLGACLASLSPGVLFELCLTRSCELVTSRCANCRLFQRLRPTFEANVTTAFRMLHGVRAAANLKETTPLFLPQIDECRAHAALSEATMSANIRALFVKTRTSNVLEGRAPLALRQKRKHVPMWRNRVRDLWFEHGLSASGACDFAWPELVVDSKRCRACGVCMQMCPTGSISHALVDGMFVSSFIPGSCADCGLCLTVCPEGALSRTHRTFTHPFLAVDTFSRAAKRCIRCGMPVLENLGDLLCVPCAAAANRRPLIERIREQLGVRVPGDEEV